MEPKTITASGWGAALAAVLVILSQEVGLTAFSDTEVLAFSGSLGIVIGGLVTRFLK